MKPTTKKSTAKLNAAIAPAIRNFKPPEDLTVAEWADRHRRHNTKVYDSNYNLVRSDELYINSLNGIDSLKNFVENDFYEWLKNTYPDNFLVKELV